MFHDYCLKWWDIGLICNRMAGLWHFGINSSRCTGRKGNSTQLRLVLFYSLQPAQLMLLIPNTTASHPITYTNNVSLYRGIGLGFCVLDCMKIRPSSNISWDIHDDVQVHTHTTRTQHTHAHNTHTHTTHTRTQHTHAHNTHTRTQHTHTHTTHTHTHTHTTHTYTHACARSHCQ